MADNYSFSQGAGTVGASDDVGGVHYPRIKLSWGVDGAAADASHTNPLPVRTGALATSTNVGGTTSATPNTWTTVDATDANRRRIQVQNRGSVPIELGFGADVAMVELYPGDIWWEDGYTGSVRVRCPTAASQTISGYKLAV